MANGILLVIAEDIMSSNNKLGTRTYKSMSNILTF